MSTAANMRALDAFARRVDSLPGVLAEIAEDGARIIRDEIATNIDRGVAPDGTRWPETEDGHAPLVDAMKAVTVEASGATIKALVAAGSIEERHNAGRVRGGRKRQIIPTTLSSSARESIAASAQARFRSHMETAR